MLPAGFEEIAPQIGDYFGIQILVFPFDAGQGMPEPSGYRDLPHVWAKGFYKMEQDKLRAALSTAKLVIGSCRIRFRNLWPGNFLAFDLDYYTSPKHAFQILSAEQHLRLPRIYCYFDEIVWPELACHNQCTGQLLAIQEFNDAPGNCKIAPIHMLRQMRAHPAAWNDMIYVMHDFSHPQYCVNLMSAGEAHSQLPI